MREWKNIFHANQNDKKEGVAIFISDKIDFYKRLLKKQRRALKWSLQEEDVTLINIYAPNIRASKCIKQIPKDINGAIDNNIITVGEFNTPLTSIDSSPSQKINKATSVLNDNRPVGLNWYLQDTTTKINKKQKQNTSSFQEHMGHSLGQTI